MPYKNKVIKKNKKESTFTKTKKLYNKKNIKQIGGNSDSNLDYWRMSIPGGTGTEGSFGTLLDDIVAVVASSVNTIVDTVHFVENVMSLKGDMGTEFSSSGAPGAGTQ